MSEVKRDTQSRVQRLQHLCSALSLRSMVFILGIDSRKNRTTEKLFHWLFTGASGNAHLSSLSLSLDYEEVAWVVTPTQVHVFLGCACGGKKETAEMHAHLMEVCASWPGVVIEHLAESEFEDSDAAEDTKMMWFTRLMQQLEGSTGLCGDVEVETWPLIQAYALDLFGLGFFSMKHPALNVTSHIEALFHEFDACLFQTIKQEQIQRITNSLSQTREAVNKRNYVLGRRELAAATLAEFLMIPFEYALLQSEKTCRVQPEVRLYPNAEGKLHTATHATVRAVCGQTNLICARSWFFAPHKSLRDLITRQQELVPLMDLYRAVVSSLRTVLPNCQDEAQAMELFQHKLLQHHVFRVSPSFLDAARYQVSLVLRSIDADGNEQPFDPSRLPLHTVQVTLSNIRSEAGDMLGGLEFAESFNTADQFELLTESVPVMGVWDKREEGAWTVDYGQRLVVYENFTLVAEDLELLGALWVYKTALVFISQACGRIDVVFSEVKEFLTHPGNWLQINEENCSFKIKINTACLNFLESTLGGSIPREEQRPASPSETPLSPEAPVSQSGPALVVITGVPSSGKTKLAEQLSKQFSVPHILPQPQEQAYFNDHYYKQAIVSAQAPLVVVVLPGYTAAQRLEGNIVCVIVKLHSEMVMRPDRRGWQPLIRELIIEAHVGIVEEVNEMSAAFKRQVKRMNPDLSLFYVKTMLAPSMLRAVWAVRKPPRYTPVELPLLPLQSTYIQVPIPLNRSKLEENLWLLQEKHSDNIDNRVAAERGMSIWHLKGTVLISSPKGMNTFKVTGSPGNLSFRSSTEEQLGLLAVGLRLEPGRICMALLNSRSLADKVPLRTRESITVDEMDVLSQGLETPEGYFFDGYYYINADGEKTKKHPLLDSRIASFLEDENDRIGDFNRKLQKESANLQRSNTDVRVYSIFS